MTTILVDSVAQMGAVLRDARKGKGITQQQLAEQLDIPRTWLSQFEQGKILNASLRRVVALCKALHVSLSADYDVEEHHATTAAQTTQTTQSQTEATTRSRHQHAHTTLEDFTLKATRRAETSDNDKYFLAFKQWSDQTQNRAMQLNSTDNRKDTHS